MNSYETKKTHLLQRTTIQLEANLTMHNHFHNALAYLILIELWGEQNKADISLTFLRAWLQ